MNRKKGKIFLLLVLLSTQYGFSQNDNFEVPEYIGEVIDFQISYGFLNSGVGTLSYDEDTLSGQYYIKAVAKTVGLANVLYKILDIYECYMDPATGFPVKAVRNVREGRYREYNEVIYDFHSRPDSTIVHSQKSGTQIVPKEIYDILSGFFHFRKNYVSRPMNKGEMILIRTYFTDEIFDLRIRFLGKETIKTKLGKIKCLKFSPVTEVGRAFKTEDDMLIWFSDDKNFVPVKIWFDLPVGSVTSALVSFKGLKYEFSSLTPKK